MKILVVDNDPDFTELMLLHLAKAGYEPKSVLSGEDALEEINRCKPDLVLADIDMPGMDGLSMCKVMKGSSDTEHIPFIILTGLRDIDDTDIVETHGVDALFHKPFKISELFFEVDRQLKRHAG